MRATMSGACRARASLAGVSRCARAGGGRRPDAPTAVRRSRRAASPSAASSRPSSARATTTRSSTTPTTSATRCGSARLRLFGEWRPSPRLSLVGELRTENADARRRRRRSTSAGGRSASPRLRTSRPAGFRRSSARFARRAYGRDNVVIGHAARVSVPHVAAARRPAGDGRRPAAHARPRLAAELSHRLGRRSTPGVPLVSASRGTPASQALWRRSGFEVVRRRHARARRPCPWSATRNDGLMWSGPRRACICRTGLTVGVSGARGAWLERRRPGARCRRRARARASQTLVGADVEFGRGAWLVRGEWLRSRFELPIVARAGADAALDAWSGFVEARYRLHPRWQVGVRVERLAFGRRRRARRRRRRLPWDAPVDRVEGVARIPGDAAPRAPRRLAAQLARRRPRPRARLPGARRCSTGSDASMLPLRLARRRVLVAALLGAGSAGRRRATGGTIRGRVVVPRRPGRPGAARGRRPRRPPHRRRRPAPRRRLPRVGAASGLRRAAARPRAHGPARRTVRPARARDHGRHDRRFPEQRHDVSQRRSRSSRVQAVRSRPVSRRAGPARCGSIGRASCRCSATFTRT